MLSHQELILSPHFITLTSLKTQKKDNKIQNETHIAQESKFKGIYFYNNFFQPNLSKPWFFNLPYPRRHIVTINRLRSNHYSLALSLHRKNIITSPSCSCGQIEQNISHILWYCPVTTSQEYLF